MGRFPGRRDALAPRLGPSRSGRSGRCDLDRMTGEGTQAAYDAASAAARRSYGRLVAYLSARTRDVAGAEDALSEAFAAALADWPKSGVPRNPEAWLLAAARRKSIDAARRRRTVAEA